MRKVISIIILMGSIQLFAQDLEKKYDFRLGSGISIFGSGDMTPINLENEINYKNNLYFTSSVSLNYGRSTIYKKNTLSYMQGNINIFISPFKNTRKNDFRIGTGLSFINISQVSYQQEAVCGVGLEQHSQYNFDMRNSIGYNVMLEHTYSINKKFLLGIKLYTQPYYNGDINTGVVLKLGVKL